MSQNADGGKDYLYIRSENVITNTDRQTAGQTVRSKNKNADDLLSQARHQPMFDLNETYVLFFI